MGGVKCKGYKNVKFHGPWHVFLLQVRFDVGRCKPLSNIYHGLTNTVCHHYTAGLVRISELCW